MIYKLIRVELIFDFDPLRNCLDPLIATKKPS